jgi:tetratricopeptide (TPR) repeat protein
MNGETKVNGLQSRLAIVQEEARTNPNNVASQSRLGWILLGLKNFDDAKNIFETALSRWPENVELNYASGITFKALDQTDKAVERFQKAIEGKAKTARESMFQLIAAEQINLIRR